MKKLICILLLACFIGYGCGSSLYINGKEYKTYGFLDSEEDRNPRLQYRLIWGNLIWGCLLIETVIAPVYFFGFSLWEPTGVKEWQSFDL